MKEFGFLLRPTLREYNNFVHLLDKILVGYPLDSGSPNILWSASAGFGVPIGDDRAVRRRLDRDGLLRQPVEQLAAAA